MSKKTYNYGERLRQSRLNSLKITATSLFATAALALTIVLPLTAAHAQGPNAGGGGGGGGTVTTTGSDVQMSGSASTNSPDPGSVYTYTYKIKNSGPQAATQVVFTAPTPVGTTPNYATLDGSTFPCVNEGDNANSGSSAVCSIGTLAKGAQATVIVNVTAPQVAQQVTSTATISSTSTDPVLTNNTVAVTVTVKAPNGGVCKGGVCDTVPVASTASCAVLTNVTAPVGYYSIWAAVWNDFTIQSCSTSTENVVVEVQETNVATGNVEYSQLYAVSLVPSQNVGVVLDNDFAPFNTTYNITYTVRDGLGNVLDTASVQATTPSAL